ncbi:MAG: right-handed parallel beta-helix repeat-containing protein [Kiritimatiellales bacterium]
MRIQNFVFIALTVLAGSGAGFSYSIESASAAKMAVPESGFYVLRVNAPKAAKISGGIDGLQLLSDAVSAGGSTLPLGFIVKDETVCVEAEPVLAASAFSLDKAAAKTIKNETGRQLGAGETVLHQVAESGFYGLVNAKISAPSSGAALPEIQVFVGDQAPVLRRQINGATEFDTEIGWLGSGDRICIELSGAGNFSADYDIVYLESPDIRTQVDNGCSAGKSSIRIHPGRYYAGGYHPAEIYLTNRSDIDINAHGVRMVIRNVQRRVLQVESSSNITLRGLISDYDPLLFSQGTILDVAANGSWIDMAVHTGYPAPNWPDADRLMVHHSDSLMRKKFSRDLRLSGIVKQSDSTYRLITTTRHTDHGWSAGDYVSTPNQAMGYTVWIKDSAGIVLQDVTLHCARGWSICEYMSTGCAYERVNLIPGPRPLLAEVARLRSAHSDGIHSKFGDVGPRIENCRFIGLGDDAIAIHGGFGVVLKKTSGKTLDISAQDEIFHPGDTVRVYNDTTGTFVERKIVAVGDSAVPLQDVQTLLAEKYPRYSFRGLYKVVMTVTLDKAVDAEPGELMSNRNRNGSGFVARNNEICNTRARGIIIKASDGVIEGNTISHCALPGILLAAEADNFMEADMVSNVIVSSNVLNSVNEGCHASDRLIHAGAITVSFSGKNVIGHFNLQINDNEFVNVGGVNININNAGNVSINRNRFINSHGYKDNAAEKLGVNNGSFIHVDNAMDVTLGSGADANVYQNPGPYIDKANLISIGANAKNVTGKILSDSEAKKIK